MSIFEKWPPRVEKLIHHSFLYFGEMEQKISYLFYYLQKTLPINRAPTNPRRAPMW
jgi:hypothetical protein